MTRDFAMVAYSNKSTSIESDMTIAVPMLASASATIWGTWRTRCSPHTNYGPQECSPPPPDRVTDFSSLQSPEASRIPSEFNQCVFIRYYTMRMRRPLALFPKVIRAGAGPHDLDPGGNTGNTFPELMVQSDAEPTMGNSGDYEEQQAPTAENTDLQPDVVIRNTPYDKEYDTWDAVADYIFQNSNAISVLMHHRDLAGMYAGSMHDISFLLATNKPRIVVDESGVGRIICRHSHHTEVSQSNDSPIIDGVLKDCGLTLSLPRFDARELTKIDDVPSKFSGFCDISAGETSEGLTVVIESHRCYAADSQGSASVLKRFYRHAFICSRLSHANIVPFLGVFSSNKFPYACVFESVGKENIVEYLARNPDSSRLKLLAEVARGLKHIHDLDIVHGSIRGNNILIDGQEVARIAEFASATMIPDIALEGIGESVGASVSRWCSPEILHPGTLGLSKVKFTRASDIYAFGMLAYEIYSGRVPFHGKTDVAVTTAIITTDERPSRPDRPELSDQLWAMVKRCWRRDPSQRPTILEVATFLERYHRS